MSFLIKNAVGSKLKFYFDGSRILDALVDALTNPQSNGFNGLEYKLDGDDPIKDRDNVAILKEELGTDFIEKKMLKQFTRNNNVGDEIIKNNFQLNLYKDLIRTNNFLAAMFLYFFHKFSYNAWPEVVLIKDSTNGINTYRTYMTNNLQQNC